MKKVLVISFLISFTLVTSQFIDNVEAKSLKNVKTVTLVSDKKAADFKLKTLEGKEIRLSDYRGKIVIIDFWATWCPPCRKGIPDLISLQEEFKKDLVVIGISLDQQNTIKDLKPFIENYKINYPVVLGDEKVVKDYGGISAIPTSFIIDQKGNIVDSHVGLVPKAVYADQIKSLLKKK
ncbi:MULTISPECIES: TlpA disulfide reductase family protein [Ignavibacterium]|jgi:cytochrome c biogenesis protein CcmG/thiol:disulfide interchange protein DsbE|uniref:TlpA family protein disulfide reductase n=1 Tax=Ignavibacterium TaxID=795750 RepID=UPI0025C6ED88|nr:MULTISPECIES: TlpA disulfide reductase family protein [Ignavibacterium]MBI5660623.1 TlpA family protein disulfide reductase [Ignavibacterium album]